MKSAVKRLERRFKKLIPLVEDLNIEWVALGNGHCRLDQVSVEIDPAILDPKHPGFSFIWCKDPHRNPFADCSGCPYHKPEPNEDFQGEVVEESIVKLNRIEKLSPRKWRFVFEDLAKASILP